MVKIELGELLATGIISVAQEVELYLVSFSKQVAFKGNAREIPEGYHNFKVNGLLAEGDVLKIRIAIG